LNGQTKARLPPVKPGDGRRRDPRRSIVELRRVNAIDAISHVAAGIGELDVFDVGRAVEAGNRGSANSASIATS
jgi:hypothetical protein